MQDERYNPLLQGSHDHSNYTLGGARVTYVLRFPDQVWTDDWGRRWISNREE